MSERKAENLHQTVLLNESVGFLNIRSGGLYVDATLGLGGHTEGILALNSGARVIGIDQDADAIKHAEERLSHFGERIRIVHSNFTNIKSVVGDLGYEGVDGVLADLGVSSLQLDSGERGFSFRFDAPLDMRMDTSSDLETAAELLATLTETEIADIIYRYGEERASRRIAKWIVEKRDAGQPIETTRQLAELVERAVRRGPKDKIHPATRTFQALRIAVNRELEFLERFVLDSIEVLKPEGRLAIITFHSLEDRVVKQTFQRMSGKCSCPPRIPQCMCGAKKVVEILTKKPVVPGEDEIAANARSRSAKLRAVEKLDLTAA
jgi:16S rRNA (cytosine1402-N4)-methyltransferase